MFPNGPIDPIIKPSSELRKNYNQVADICRQKKRPVFLTRNGEGDTVLMDIATYSYRERELLFAADLLESERMRQAGHQGHSVEELEAVLDAAIEHGAKDTTEHGA